ncbi:hypothetical protein MnTg03_01147 [bacterium MnTg03]|nr:hypothetical protein MnTg03_01147 [bacterium MnTg03]
MGAFRNLAGLNLLACSVRIVQFAILLLMMPLVVAEDGVAFRVQNASFSLDETLLELNCEIEIELPTYISIAIEQGFAVPLMFEVEILSPIKYWPDRKIVSLKQQYQLHFLPMLGSYVIFDLNAGQRYYFDSLNEAVENLHEVNNYPMLDVNNISDERSYYARLRFGIDSDELPLPLKSSSLWDNDWNLKSEWYAWDIEK